MAPCSGLHQESVAVENMVLQRQHLAVDLQSTSGRRGQRDVVVIVQTSTLEREVDVCVRSNFVTNGLPYGWRCTALRSHDRSVSYLELSNA